MEKYFDEFIERKGTDSKKWDLNSMLEMSSYSDEESIPMWVADMDFKAPKKVIEKIIERASHGVFGYNNASENYFKAIKFWQKKRNNFEIDENWVVIMAGVVPALCHSVLSFTKEGEGVVVQNPVYPPFKNAITLNNRKVVNNSLKLVNGKYEIDFEDLEEKLKNPCNTMMILCNPHNPVGRVWTYDELKKIADLCAKYNVTLVSDEIHSDLILFGHRFISMGTFENIKNNLIICTSVTKTFNLAGLRIANTIIPNEKLRETFKNDILKVGGTFSPSLFGAIALEEVYTEEGEKWLEELRKYLEENFILIENFFKENSPKVKVTKLEGTYLAWIDFRGLEISYEEFKKKMETEAKIVIDGGEIFGEEGRGFIRLNFACHKSTLIEALNRLKNIL